MERAMAMAMAERLAAAFKALELKTESGRRAAVVHRGRRFDLAADVARLMQPSLGVGSNLPKLLRTVKETPRSGIMRPALGFFIGPLSPSDYTP